MPLPTEVPRASTVRRALQRLRRGLGVVGWGLAATAAPALAQTAPAVPPHWIGYATQASDRLQASLSDPTDETVQRLHARLQEGPARADQSVALPPLVVRVWVAADGWVERLAFDPMGDAQADADLRTLLSVKPLGAPPPDMRQPLVLQLTLSVTARS